MSAFCLCGRLLRRPTTTSPKLSSLHYSSRHPQKSQTNSRVIDLIYNPLQTLPTHLSNCTNLLHLNRLHAVVIRTQLLELESEAFHWNNIVRCYSRMEAPFKGLFVYIEMCRAGVVPDRYSIPLVLKCSIQAFDVLLGKQIHGLSLKLNLECNEFCESGLICLYSKAGEFDNALKVFDENRERKLGSWNAIIGGLAQGGRALEAINMFLRMRDCGLQPDDVTMVSVTSACGSLGNSDLAFQLHKCVYQARTLERSDLLMFNSLVDMYGKCGRMDLAYRVFFNMNERNVSSWTSMIVGYAMHGHVNKALECFKQMTASGTRPNHVTFVGVLSACVHGGLVQEGKQYFHMMKNSYNIIPQMNHFGCMVDLFGRAGLFDEAKEILKNMSMKPNSVLWGCLMGACEKYGNVEMAELAAKNLQELEPWNNGCLVVLSNIYASKGMWLKVESVRQTLMEGGIAKIPAYSSATRNLIVCIIGKRLATDDITPKFKVGHAWLHATMTGSSRTIYVQIWDLRE